MNNRKFSILGDSISTLCNYNPEGYSVYYIGSMRDQSGVFSVEDTWWGKVIDAHAGSLLVNNSWSGSRVTAMPGRSGLFPSGCSDERTSGLHIGSTLPDIIIVFLGFNDWSNGVPIDSDETRLLSPVHFNAFEEAYEAMVRKLTTRYPNAAIWCCTLPRTYISKKPSFTFPEAFANIHIEEYNNAIRKLQEDFPIKIIDLYSAGCRYDSMDGIHPTKQGMQQIADKVIELTTGTELLLPPETDLLTGPETELLIEPETEFIFSYKESNMAMLKDTLSIFQKGFYQKSCSIIKCLPSKKLTQATVFFPEDIKQLRSIKRRGPKFSNNCSIFCENTDSFSAAIKLAPYVDKYYSSRKSPANVLVLNFANPTNPGGGVRSGAIAQEEDLCRKSSLLLSLESDSAKPYYSYHQQLSSPFSSDSIILSPEVQIIKDAEGFLLEAPVTVSVLTCAAPIIRQGIGKVSQEQYRNLFTERIAGILGVAASLGYRVLVLGAFGCGAFGNDAEIVAEIFQECIKEYCEQPFNLSSDFCIINFAVLDNTEDQYNYKAFSARFN